jgi:hypothetical protein
VSADPDTIAFYQARAPHWVFHSGDAHGCFRPYRSAGFMIAAQETHAGKASDGTMRDWIDLIVRTP